jgi:hypothetical protein
MAGRSAFRISTSGLRARLVAQEGDFVHDGRDHGVAAERPKTGRLDLERDAGRQVDGVLRLARDQRGERRDALEEGHDVA